MSLVQWMVQCINSIIQIHTWDHSLPENFRNYSHTHASFGVCEPPALTLPSGFSIGIVQSTVSPCSSVLIRELPLGMWTSNYNIYPIGGLHLFARQDKSASTVGPHFEDPSFYLVFWNNWSLVSSSLTDWYLREPPPTNCGPRLCIMQKFNNFWIRTFISWPH